MCWKCDLIAPVCRFHAGPEWMFNSKETQVTVSAESTCPPVLRGQTVAIQHADSGGTQEPRTDEPYDAPRWAVTGACLPFASTAHAKFFDSRAFDLRSSRAERATVRGDHSLPGVRGPTNDGQTAAHVIEDSGFVHSSSSKNCPGSLRKANTLVGLSGPCPRRLPAASA